MLPSLGEQVVTPPGRSEHARSTAQPGGPFGSVRSKPLTGTGCRPGGRLLVALLMVMIGSVPRLAAQPAEFLVSIDPAERHQTFDGWGASGLWWPAYFDRMPEADQNRVLQLLFTNDEVNVPPQSVQSYSITNAGEGANANGYTFDSRPNPARRVRGLGMQVYRYHLPSGSGEDATIPSRRSPLIEVQPGVYDLSRDRVGIEMLKRVRALGVEHYVLACLSPPPRMTVSGSTTGGPGGGPNLKPGSAGEFAVYLADVAELVVREAGLPAEHVWISPLNEPQWRWGENSRAQEGCHLTPEQCAQIVHALAAELDRRGLPFRIDTPESGSWASSPPYADSIFGPFLAEGSTKSDAEREAFLKRVPRFAMHSYWSNEQHKREFMSWFTAKYPMLPVAQTEVCEMRGGHDPTMRSGLIVARMIHEDLTIGNTVEWHWWQAASWWDYGDHLIHLKVIPGSGHMADMTASLSGSIELTRRFDAMGHFARFIPRGSVRIGAHSLPQSGAGPGLLASAFETPEGRRVLVLINETESPIHVRLSQSRPGDFDLAEPMQAASLVEAFITDDSDAMARLRVVDLPARLTEADGTVGLEPGLTAELTPRSISTIVLEQ